MQPSPPRMICYTETETLPIICDVVDLLMPELRPYEVSFYIYLLRHSIVANGTRYVRVSRRGMQSGVMKSAYASGSGETSFAAVRDGMTALEGIGAIRQQGEPKKEGTLYRVLLPEEIETVSGGVLRKPSGLQSPRLRA